MGEFAVRASARIAAAGAGNDAAAADAAAEPLMADAWTVTTHGKTSDNINLDERTIDVLTATYGGTRIGAQELDGKLLEDVEGALWTAGGD